MTEPLVIIKVIGPPKSRKTSIAFTIGEALREKGFFVDFVDPPDNDSNIQSLPRDIEDAYGKGRTVRVETVQTNRTESKGGKDG